MGIFEEMSRITDLFADHFVSSKNVTFLRHIAFLPLNKTRLIEIDFLTKDVLPREITSKIFLKTIQYYKEMVLFEISNSKLDISKLTTFSMKLSYKPGDLSRYYTASVSIVYDEKEFSKSVLSSFS